MSADRYRPEAVAQRHLTNQHLKDLGVSLGHRLKMLHAISELESASGKTLPRLIPAASQYAGKEKIGVHVIAAKNPTIIDLEIGFTEPSEDGDEPRGLRIDLAALHPAENGQATLVFYEAKPHVYTPTQRSPYGARKSSVPRRSIESEHQQLRVLINHELPSAIRNLLDDWWYRSGSNS